MQRMAHSRHLNALKNTTGECKCMTNDDERLEKLQQGAAEYRQFQKRKGWRNSDPFVRKTDDTGRTPIVGVRLNAEERAALERDKELCDIDLDATMIKLLMELGRNVLYGQVGEPVLKYLVSQRRTRYTPRKKR